MAKRKIVTAILIPLLVLIIWIWWGNQALVLTNYTVESERLPKGFHDFRVALVADLHNTQIGKDNKKLLSMLRDAKPHMIAITGDMIDSRRTNIDVALKFAEESIKIAPCYYVAGNHESRIEEYDAFKASLTELGVTVLEDEYLILEHSGQTITLVGVEDPSFQTDYLLGDSVSAMNEKLCSLLSENNSFQVLLSHRPELYQVYVDGGIDLVLSGHAHGGQFRLPMIGGLFAPNQGFFPTYDGGLYIDGNTHMIVSRGIGNSLIPFRFNNRPELVLIELKTSKTSD